MLCSCAHALTFRQAESAFYVLYLLPFTLGAPGAAAAYPWQPARAPVTWPPDIERWIVGHDLRYFGAFKRRFFMLDDLWYDELEEHFARLPDRAGQHALFKKLLMRLHHKVFWHRLVDPDDKKAKRKRTFEPTLDCDLQWEIRRVIHIKRAYRLIDSLYS